MKNAYIWLFRDIFSVFGAFAVTTLLILFLLKFFMKQTNGALKQDCGGLTLTLEKKCHFLRRVSDSFFGLSSGKTRSWLSYEHSPISRRERDYILLFSCFETRSRLQKIISRGWARKNEADSRREFPGSRILADLWSESINIGMHPSCSLSKHITGLEWSKSGLFLRDGVK